MNAAGRRELARALTRVGRAAPGELLAMTDAPSASQAGRIGFTGPPGAGKSTLIGQLVARRAERMSARGGIAVLAVDPTSPRTGGAILGDRVRMDGVATHPGVFVRSFASGSATDSLTDNIVQLLATVDRHGFAETFLETVGSGQLAEAVRRLVDVLVLVIPAGAGDSIQAMKAGVVELADVIAVTRAEEKTGGRMAAELRSICGRSFREPPEIIVVASEGDPAIAQLDAALDARLMGIDNPDRRLERRRESRRYELRSLVLSCLHDLAERKDLNGARSMGDLLTDVGHSLLALAEAHPSAHSRRAGESQEPQPTAQ